MTIAQQLIKKYERDMETGVPMSIVYAHCHRQINRLEKIDSQHAKDTVAELMEWVYK